MYKQRIKYIFILCVVAVVIALMSAPIIDKIMKKMHPERYQVCKGDEHNNHEASIPEEGLHETRDEHDDSSEDEHEGGILTLDQETRQMIALESEIVGKRMLGKRIRVYGKIAKDTDKYQHLTSKGNGTIRQVHVVLGSIVEKGTKLLTVQKDDGTFNKIVSPGHGTIIGIYVQAGEPIDNLKSLISVVNLDTLRASVDVYEKDLRFISIGQMIEVKTIAYPEKTFLGKIIFVSPEIDDESNAIKVRVDVDNRTHLLKLGMAITGDILYEADKEVVVVPRSAIQKVNGESVVFIVSEDGDFELREISLGQSMDSVMEVRYGVNVGERIVTDGSFFLKAEMEKGSFGDGHNH